MNTKDTITVTILSPDAVEYNGQVTSLSSKNSEGNFDVMPDHANFMTLIQHEPITMYMPNNTKQTFTYENAVLFFQDNEAKIYIHHAVGVA